MSGLYVALDGRQLAFFAASALSGVVGFYVPRISSALRRLTAQRSHQTVAGDEYLLGGRLFPLRLLDAPGEYKPGDLSIRVGTPPSLPDVLERSYEHLTSVMGNYSGHRVFFDGECFGVRGWPQVGRAAEGLWERSVLRMEIFTYSYFRRVLLRGAAAPEIVELFDSDRPPGVPCFADVRKAASELVPSDGYVSYPGLGINFVVVARDNRQRPWALLQVRGHDLAEFTGRHGASLHESASRLDLTPHGELDMWATVRRAAREELGLPLGRIAVLAFGVDEGRLLDRRHVGGGFEFMGFCETDLPAERLAESRFRGRDLFEIASAEAVELTPHAIAEYVSATEPVDWFAPALYALVETLERYVPGSWAYVSERLADAWPSDPISL